MLEKTKARSAASQATDHHFSLHSPLLHIPQQENQPKSGSHLFNKDDTAVGMSCQLQVEYREHEIVGAAETIGNDPQLLRNRIDLINALGVVGERRVVALVGAALDSRLLLADGSGQQGLAVQICGERGSGKSHTLETCLKVHHESSYHHISTGSDKSFFYFQKGLKHRAIILGEAFKLEKQRDTEFAYTLRCLLSEGRVVHQVAQKGKMGFHTQEIAVEGPVSFLTTTTVEGLERQMESRTLKIHPDESSAQTSKIVSRTAEVAAGRASEADEKQTKIWQKFHQGLKPAQVIVPFAVTISRKLAAASSLPLTTRRAFKKLLSLVRAIAILYQHQRSMDYDNHVLAEVPDYHMAIQIAGDLFEDGVNTHSEGDEDRLAFLQSLKTNSDLKTLAKKWNVSKTAVSKWVKRMAKDGFVAWCDKSGNPFPDDLALRTAKHSGTAHLKAINLKGQPTAILLPSAFELTGDPEWDKGGRLWRFYDLALDQ